MKVIWWLLLGLFVIAGVGATVTLIGDWDDDDLSTWHEYRTSKTDPFDADVDDDGLLDSFELDGPTDPFHWDTDRDGLGDGYELSLGTDPLRNDTDGDGYDDIEELSKGYNPLLADSDGDGFDDKYEVEVSGTDPLLNDTDEDGILDGDEEMFGTSPLDADFDNDTLLDGFEVYVSGTNPLHNDTDMDELLDPDELNRYGTNPLLNDTDLDTLLDVYELFNSTTNPLKEDTDGDGLLDPDELFYYGTNATHPDSDLDGLMDGEEFALGTDPLLNDTDGDTILDGVEPRCAKVLDCDDDGVDDVDEWEHGLNPENSTTYQGLLDAALLEYELTSLESRNDTDMDGIPDGLEENDKFPWGPFEPEVGVTDFLVEAAYVRTSESGTFDFNPVWDELEETFANENITLQVSTNVISRKTLPPYGDITNTLHQDGTSLFGSKNPFVHVIMLSPGMALDTSYQNKQHGGRANPGDQHTFVMFGDHVQSDLGFRTIRLFESKCVFIGDCGPGLRTTYDLAAGPFFRQQASAPYTEYDLSWTGWLTDDIAGLHSYPGGPTLKPGAFELDNAGAAHAILHQLGFNFGLCRTDNIDCYRSLLEEEKPEQFNNAMSNNPTANRTYLPSQWAKIKQEIACTYDSHINAVFEDTLHDFRYIGDQTGRPDLYQPRRCV